MSKGKLVAVIFVWLVIFGVGAVAWRYLVQPRIEQTEQQRAEQRINFGSSDSRYDHRVNLSLDGFSGYAVLRSQEFAKELSDKSIKVNFVDDGADYRKRIDDLKTGKSQMAVFTIDALLKTSAEVGDLPASIVAMIDETRGADAIVGFKSKYPDADALNNPNLRFVLTPDSPSETLARVVMTHFKLPNLAANPIIRADGAEAVYKQYRQASQNEDKVYVLWEPYVSKALENPNMRIIVSSRDYFGYIVDVLVVSREFLRDKEPVVKDIIECYFRAAYTHRTNMKGLVLSDAQSAGEPLTQKQAERLVNGVQWKDTRRNYAHFGIDSGSGLQHIEDMIERITKVLLATDAMSSDPTGGKPNLLYYRSILDDLKGENFHPEGTGAIDDSLQLRALTDQEWRNLDKVGTMNVDELVFRRGTAKLERRSQNTLDELADALRTQQFYVEIAGVALRRGNQDLNKKLAASRAQAALEYLVQKGIDADRIRAAEPSLGASPSVNFKLGQLPY